MVLAVVGGVGSFSLMRARVLVGASKLDGFGPVVDHAHDDLSGAANDAGWGVLAKVGPETFVAFALLVGMVPPT